MNRSLRALAHRSYLFVWMGSLLSNVGNWMENVGQGWVVASQTHSPFLVELLSFSQFIPVIFLALPAGIIADRFNRKKILIIAQISMCVFAATLAILAHLNMLSPGLIIAITFLEGAAWALNAPAWQTVIPHLVPRSDLESAIALNSIQYNLARLLGPALAGVIVEHFGFAYAFDINAISFIAVILAIVFIKFDSQPNPPKTAVTLETSYKSAWKWVLTHPGAKRIIFSVAAFAIFSAPIQGLMPFFASDILHVGPKGLGVLLACVGAGAVTGAFMLGQLPVYYPRHHLIPLSMSALGIFSLLYSQAPSPPWCIALLFIAGVFWLWTLVSCNTAMQLLVPDEIRGRAMSILLIAHVGMLPLGHILGGVLAKYAGPRTTLSLTSTALILIGIATLIKRVPEIDGLDKKAPRLRFKTFFSEIILASSQRAEALSLDRSEEIEEKSIKT